MISMERRKFYIGGSVAALSVPTRPFPCPTPLETRAMLPVGKDVVGWGH
jgi:sulfate adenylyltransferase